jgi:hypothetical protein
MAWYLVEQRDNFTFTFYDSVKHFLVPKRVKVKVSLVFN